MAAPFSIANLVHQSATTTGTGNFTLAALSGKQTLDTAFGHGSTTDVFEYFISSQAQAEWEHGTGHMSDATTLVRDTVWDSSNSGSAVSFSAGTKDVTSAISAQGSWAPRGYIDGMVLSNDATNTKLDVAAGLCRDDTDAMSIRFTASKVIDCTTVGANGLDAGSLANSTWYHVYAVGKRDGSAQAGLVSTSASAPTLPAGYQYKRRLGAVKTDGSAHFLGFVQLGDEFLWKAPVNEWNATAVATAATLVTLAGVPTGLQVWARLRCYVSGPNTAQFLVQSPDETSAVGGATTGNVDIVQSASVITSSPLQVRTNTSAQVRWNSSAASTTAYGVSLGWIDQRGKNT
jgi:hypothetical protein